MEHVSLPQEAAQARLRRRMMYVVVDHVISHIARGKTGKDDRREIGTERQPQDQESACQDRHAEERRHDKAERIGGVTVVNSVNEIVHTLADLARELHMEHEPMAEILEESPQQIAGGKARYSGDNTKSQEAKG